MPARKKKPAARIKRTRTDTAESLKLRVRRLPGSSNVPIYVRVGPDSPLWRERMAERVVEKARAGDTDAAKRILRDFTGAIDQWDAQTWRGPIYWPYAQYLQDAFEKILAGADARLALGVKNSKAGRRPGAGKKHDEDGLAAALNVLLLHGLTRKDAKLSLHEKTGASVRNIERANEEHLAYRLYLPVAQDADESEENRDFAVQIIKGGAERYAAEINAIIAARKAR